MKRVAFLRIATYSLLIAIFWMSRSTLGVIPLRLAQQEDAPSPFPPVSEDLWQGKDQKWIDENLGEPLWEHMISLPVPNYGMFLGIQKKIDQRYPGYRGQIKSLEWIKGPRCFHVFMIVSGDTWVVLEGLSWQEGTMF